MGETYGMSLHEFGHFIQATGAINYRNQSRKIGIPDSSSCLLKHFPESIFASITDSDEQENSKSTNLMSRVDFVYGLLKVALRNADDSLRNVCHSTTCVVLTNYRSWN